MTFSIAAWLSILPLPLLLISRWCQRPFNPFNPGNDQSFRDKKYIKEASSTELTFRLRISLISLFLAILFCFLMVLQGLHLWNIGYIWDGFNITSGEAAKLTIRSRGKGGLFLLILRIFKNFTPQIIVFAYGYIFLKNIGLVKVILQSYPNIPLRVSQEKANLKERSEKVKKATEAIMKWPKEKRVEYLRQLQEKNDRKNEINNRTSTELEVKVPEGRELNEILLNEPEWLDNEKEEGWLIDPKNNYCKSFIIEKKTKRETFIRVQESKKNNIESSFKENRSFRLNRMDALGTWRNHLIRGWKVTSAQTIER